MFGSNFAEIGLGLSLLFLLLSLACSMSSELVSRMLSWRATMLEEGIRELLHDSAATPEVLAHPLLKGLRRDLPLVQKGLVRFLARLPVLHGLFIRWSKPSFIPSGMFAKALLDVVLYAPRKKAIAALCEALSGSGDDSLKALAARAKAAEFDDPEGYMEKLSAIREQIEALVSDKKKAAALLEPLDAALQSEQDSENAPNFTAKINIALNSVEPADFRRALRVLLAQGDGRDIQSAKGAIARWFDDGMEHVSGWYKRKTQRVVFVLALLITIALNIDTLLIGDRLSRDTTLRALVVASAESAMERHRDTEKSLAPLRSKSADPAADLEPPALGEGSSLEENIAKFRALKSEVDALELPIGWPTKEQLLRAEKAKLEKDKALEIAIASEKAAQDKATAALALSAEKQNALKTLGAETPPEEREAALSLSKEAILNAEQAVLEAKAAREQAEQAREQATIAAREAANERAFPKDGNSILKRLLGWLFTALAASLGAQFWFDVLAKLVSLRSAAKKPEPPNTSSAQG